MDQKPLNALLVLSPLDPGLLDQRTGAHAARALKILGTARADITSQPRYAYAAPSPVHKQYGLCDFSLSARALANQVFRPVIGRSDIQDLSGADTSPVMPQLETLSCVGAIFAGKAIPHANRTMDALDGRDLGLIFYLAFHGKPANGEKYDLLAFPHISSRARESLNILGDMSGPDLGEYGLTFDLGKLRTRMTQMMPRRIPANRLN